MIDTINEVFNTFNRADYPPNEKNISLVPFEHIQSWLNQTFPDAYEYKITNAGTCVGRGGVQENYVCVALKVTTNAGSVTVAGASQGPIGISGLIIGAVRNAVLRGLGAGAELYVHAEGEEPDFGNGQTAPPQTGQFQPGPPQYQQPAYPSPNGAPQGQSFGPWTGFNKQGQPIRIKSGPYGPSQQNPLGVAWTELDEAALSAMANKGVNIAQMEMRRRQGQGQPAPNPGGQQWPQNAFRS